MHLARAFGVQHSGVGQHGEVIGSPGVASIVTFWNCESGGGPPAPRRATGRRTARAPPPQQEACDQ
jgi:hypothetical protein